MPSTPIVSSIRIEGGLFPSGFLARLATFDDGLDQLTPAAYGCLPGETLRDAITDAWNRLQRVWASFQAHRASASPDGDATGDTRQRWLLPLFQVLGYTDLERAPAPEIDGKTYRLSHLYRQVPIHLIGHRLDLDKRIAGAAGAAASNAHGLVQEFLNRSPAHQWGIVSNGLTLRLLRDNASLTRQAYLEVDLEALFDQHAYHDFVQVWLLLHASRFQSAAGATSTTPGDAIIDRWYATGTKEGVRALDRLRDNVQSAIEHLGRGFLTSSGPGNRALREALAGDRLSAQDYYRELLRTVYRLLFCFVAEDRNVLLVPTATPVQRDRYARWYATSRLRRLAASRAGTPHGDGWKSLQLIFTWLSSDTGCPALGVPALGSLLWSSEATPHLDACNLSNQALFAALRALAVTTDGGVRRPIDFKNLGAEELGGIYESLLELHPELSAESGAFSLKSVAGSERKTTGSYYTPTSLIKCLLDSALDPVVEAAASKPTPAEAEQAILDLTVVDPACGSGHFLVAAAHRIAKRLASVRTGDLEPAPDAVRHALRDVISRCIYGVDLNPMSVELCKVSLWLEAIDPGRPLSFLDHRIRCGNSLIGTTPALVAKGVPDEAFDPIAGDDKDTCKQRKKRNKPERAAMETQQTSLFAVLAPTSGAPLDDLRRGDDATLASVSRLRNAWQAVENDPVQLHSKWAADAWVAAFLAPKTPGSPTITSESVRVALQTGPNGLDPQQRVVIQMMAEEYRVFHWHIAFPELFGEGRPNGFSVVLGNPPWEQIEQDTAAVSAQAWRTQLYISGSGIFPMASRGRKNLYALFAELCVAALGKQGRVGLVLPSGILQDEPASAITEDLMRSGRLVSVIDMENRIRGADTNRWFPGAHPQLRFCIYVVASAGYSRTWFIGSANTPSVNLLTGGFSMTYEEVCKLSSESFRVPLFHNSTDATTFIKAASNGTPLGSVVERIGNSFLLFNAEPSIRAKRVNYNQYYSAPDYYTPVYEGSYFFQYDHQYASFDGRDIKYIAKDPASRRGFRTEYYLPRNEVDKRLANTGSSDDKWLLCMRRQASTTNMVVAVAAIIPRAAVEGSATVFSLRGNAHAGLSLLATINSYVFNYLVCMRQSGANLNKNVYWSLPLPKMLFHENVLSFQHEEIRKIIINVAFELSYTHGDLSPLAKDFGRSIGPFEWNNDRRLVIRCLLEAGISIAYGLDRKETAYILDTFPIVKRKDEAQYGEYRTKRLILEAYDAMADAIRTGRPFQTKLDPPPADPRCAHPAAPKCNG